MKRPSRLRSAQATGLAGTTLMAVGGALAGASAPAGSSSSWWWEVPAIPVEPAAHPVVATTAFYAGLILLTRAWLWLRPFARPDRLHGRAVVATALLWALPLLVGPPLASRDVYSYAALGEVAAAGFDPYEVGPAEVDGLPLDGVDPRWQEAPTPYGPGFVALAEATSPTSDVRWAVAAFRLLALAGLALVALAIPRLARAVGRGPEDALVLILCNPLTMLHLVSGAHNEALMIGLLTLGVAVGGTGEVSRSRAVAGAALCGLAATIKAPALLGIVFVAWIWAARGDRIVERALRFAIVVAVGLSTLTVVSAATGYGWGWLSTVATAGTVRAYLSVTTGIGVVVHAVGDLVGVGTQLDRTVDVVNDLGLVIAAVIAAALLARATRLGVEALGLTMLVVALLGPSMQPWYLLWGAGLLAAARSGEANRLLVGSSVVLAFGVLPSGPDLGEVLIGHGAALVLAIAALAPLTIPFRRRAELVEDPGPARPSGTSVIVPTRHEAGNVAELGTRLRSTLEGRRAEIIFVDDSDDETPELIAEVARGGGVPVRLLHRAQGERFGGLGGAVTDGFAAASYRTAVVIDGDLQHPPELVTDLVDVAEATAAAVVVGSRFAAGGDHGLRGHRALVSRLSGSAARFLFPRRVGPVSDPMSGCFAVRLDRIDADRLRPNGFKILLELLASHDLPTAEVPLRFGERRAGRSKVSLTEGARFAGQLVDLRVAALGPWSVRAGPPARTDAVAMSSA
ncbi:MAG: polyprenol phosphomannose-dependent alpha 1,6 mannosyltransferase MptB [Actinomycetota bacterium]